MSRASAALALARGDVRDGVASIEHFLQVLGSRRVGPRVLARGIPDQLAGCPHLRTSLGALEGALRAELAADPPGIDACVGLLAHAARRVDELDAALATHAGASSLDARERLALEAKVRLVAADLGTVVRLADLLGAPVTQETTTIDLGDALAQRRARPPPGATPVLAAVDVRVDELTVGDAHLVLDLLDLAVGIASRAGIDAPRIVVAPGPEGFPVLTVDAAPGKTKDGSGGDGQVLHVMKREELPRENDVVVAAARHAGVTFTIADGGRRVAIAL